MTMINYQTFAKQQKDGTTTILRRPDFDSEFLKLYPTDYINLAQKLVWSDLFTYLGMKQDGEKEFTDIVEGGKYACAYFVSNVLAYFKLIERWSATVKSLQKQLAEKNFVKYEYMQGMNIPYGAIIFWNVENPTQESISQEHVWFYIGDNKAISNSSFQKKIVIHPLYWTNDDMTIVSYYTLP